MASSTVFGILLLSIFLAGSISSSYKVIGYYPNWAQYRQGSCQFLPEMINPSLYTHINYAFAYIDGTTYELIPTEWNDQDTDWSEGMYSRVQDLRKQNPNLKVLLSVGGWNFNYYSSTNWIFSAVAATSDSRQTFVRNALSYIVKYGFDGIDIDWEYPSDPAQGGQPQDKDNYSALLKEFRNQITNNYGGSLLLTTAMAAAQGTWEQAYNLGEIHNYVDWFNLMTYDLHGSWDGYTASQTAMNSTQDSFTITHAIQGYKNAGVPGNKIALGLALYGHSYSYSQASESCPGYYTPTTGAGPAGSCTASAGFLAYYEIVAMLSSSTRKFDNTSETPYICYGGYQEKPISPPQTGYRNLANHIPHLNEVAPSNIISIQDEGDNGSGSWACYDDKESLKYKLDYVKSQGLVGAMMWSVDMDNNDELTQYIWSSLN